MEKNKTPKQYAYVVSWSAYNGLVLKQNVLQIFYKFEINSWDNYVEFRELLFNNLLNNTDQLKCFYPQISLDDLIITGISRLPKDDKYD